MPPQNPTHAPDLARLIVIMQHQQCSLWDKTRPKSIESWDEDPLSGDVAGDYLFPRSGWACGAERDEGGVDEVFGFAGVCFVDNEAFFFGD